MNVITNLTPVEPNDAGAAVLPAPLLRLKLLGQMEGDDGLRQSILPRSRKTRAVLAVLALAAPQPVLRSRLTELLWSQRAREQGRASLRQSVHELQRALGPRAGVLLRADRNRLALLDNGLWVDVRMIVKATATDSAELEVFQPTLLDGLDGLDPAFDKWLVEQRQRVTQLVLSAAEAVLSTDDGPEVRIAAARRLLQIDSAHDGAWQALIDAHLARGERGAAMLALQRYSATLSSAGFDGLYGVQLKGTSFRATGDTVRLRVMPPRVLDTTPGDNPLPGLAEEVTAAVSRFRWISSFVEAMYDPTAGYLLDSTLQYSGNRLRIIARLLDLHAGNEVIWARRLDRPMDDLLLLQGEVAAELAAQIDPELLLREGERRNADSGNSTALTLTLRAIPAIYRLEAARFRGAGELLAAATAMDAGHAAAHAWWAYWHLFLVGQGWADDPAGATRHAGELAERAVTLDPSDARALALVGHVRAFLQKRPEEACALHERALSLTPNLPLAWCFSGLAHSYLGEHELAIEQIVRAQYLSPHDPHAFFFDMALMMPHFLQGRFEKALAFGRRAIELNPGFTSTYKGYLATLGQLGHAMEARRVLARLVGLEPRFNVRTALERSPMRRRADLRLYADGLRRAGLPEG